MTTQARALGGPLLTRPFKALLGLAALSFALVAWRFWVGLGPSTALSDGYPWGLWIAFDVVTGTALACGGYAVALLVYILNKGRYHPLVRPAILTSALGYSIAGLSVMVDLGRPWNSWKIPLFVWDWNVNSALLEVALCIMAYVVVLWIELSPAFLERWRTAPGRLGRIANKSSSFMEKALLWIIALGMLLPTMHQSSLGSMMILTGHKLHPLWSTPLLPLLFLIGCLAMGYAAVVFEGSLSATSFRLRPENRMLASLYGAAVVVTLLFVGVRIADIVARGNFGLALRPDLYGVMFWVETALLLAPVAMYFAAPQRRARMDFQFRAALFFMLAGGLYRFDTYLVAFNPGDNWSYFPAVPELLITVGFVALEVAIYVALVKRFPILAGRPQAALARS